MQNLETNQNKQIDTINKTKIYNNDPMKIKEYYEFENKKV